MLQEIQNIAFVFVGARKMSQEVAYEFNDLPFTDEQLDAICEDYPELKDLPLDELKWWLTVHYHTLNS